jgi:hypothetical protein
MEGTSLKKKVLEILFLRFYSKIDYKQEMVQIISSMFRYIQNKISEAKNTGSSTLA